MDVNKRFDTKSQSNTWKVFSTLFSLTPNKAMIQSIMTIFTSNDKRLNVIGDDAAKLDIRFTKVEANVAEIKSLIIA